DVLDAVIRICRTELSFEIIPREIKAGPVHVTDKFRIDAVKVDHSTLTYGLVFEEVKKREFLREIAISLGVKPGPDFSRLHRGEEITVDGKTIRPDNVLGGKKKCKKVVYTSDTRPCQNIIDASKDAVLIHDSTYDGSMKDQAAEATHSTSIEAAEVAARGGAKKLFLTHISPRYSSTVEMLKEAKTVFAATSVARDFQVYKP
ncbi:MAG: ribonuclease Z, partial [Candidatus Hydrothermarchaeales archaeon]